MFTGIIQNLGRIKGKEIKGDSLKFTVKPSTKKFLKGLKKGESISINGACMTMEKKSKDGFSFTTINESLSKTNLNLLKIKDLVNLESAMTLNDKLDGHIVQGHIDTTGYVDKINEMADSREYFISFSPVYRENIIPVGSITINGVSLTIAEIVNDDPKCLQIKVAIIPYTFQNTNFKILNVNDLVNIEFDMLGKYVKRIFVTENKKTGI